MAAPPATPAVAAPAFCRCGQCGVFDPPVCCRDAPWSQGGGCLALDARFARYMADREALLQRGIKLRSKEVDAARRAKKQVAAKTEASVVRRAAYDLMAHAWGPADGVNRPLPCCTRREISSRFADRGSPVYVDAPPAGAPAAGPASAASNPTSVAPQAVSRGPRGYSSAPKKRKTDGAPDGAADGFVPLADWC